MDHIRGFLEFLDLEKGLSLKSQQTYQRFIGRFQQWLQQKELQHLKPHELTDEHVWQYRLYLSQAIGRNSGEPLKRSTQSYYLIALRNLLSYFTLRDIASLPSEKVRLGRLKQERIVKVLTLDHVERLLTSPRTDDVSGLRDRAILECLFSTGMRIAELVALNRDQLRLKPDTLDLEVSIVGKGSHIRTVYFSARCVEALRVYLAARTDKDKALFISYRGKKRHPGTRLTPRSIQNLVKTYCAASGCPMTTTPHVFRHTFATDLLNKGVDIRMVQEFLGHRNIATTQVYTHVTSKRLRDIHRRYHSGDDLGK